MPVRGRGNQRRRKNGKNGNKQRVHGGRKTPSSPRGRNARGNGVRTRIPRRASQPTIGRVSSGGPKWIFADSQESYTGPVHSVGATWFTGNGHTGHSRRVVLSSELGSVI